MIVLTHSWNCYAESCNTICCIWYKQAARAATWGYTAHEYNSAVAFSSTSPMVKVVVVVGSVSTPMDVGTFATGTAGTVMAFSMMALPS